MSNNGSIANDYLQAGTRSLFGGPQLGAALTDDTNENNDPAPATQTETPASPVITDVTAVEPTPSVEQALDNTTTTDVEAETAVPNTSVADQLEPVNSPAVGSGGGGGGGALWSMLALLILSWRSRKIS